MTVFCDVRKADAVIIYVSHVLTLFCFSVWTSGRRPVLGRQQLYSGRNFRMNNLKASKKGFLETYIRLWQDTYHYKGITETLQFYYNKKIKWFESKMVEIKLSLRKYIYFDS